MGEPVRKVPQVELVWDKKRLLVGIIILLLIVGGLYLTKTLVLDQKFKRIVTQENNKGKVAGTTMEEEKEQEVIKLPSQEEFRGKIEDIKKEISTLTPEDIKNQEPVKKILQDLENLKASAEAQMVSGAKNAVCEQAKRVFCSQ